MYSKRLIIGFMMISWEFFKVKLPFLVILPLDEVLAFIAITANPLTPWKPSKTQLAFTHPVFGIMAETSSPPSSRASRNFPNKG